MSKKQKYYLSLGIILALVVIWYAANRALKLKGGTPQATPAGSSNAVQNSSSTQAAVLAAMTPLPASQVPTDFPANFPWEKSASIISNVQIKDPMTGSTQSIRAYASAKTLDQNFILFKDFFKNYGWAVISSVEQPAVKNLTVAKDAIRLSVTMTKDENGSVIINATAIRSGH